MSSNVKTQIIHDFRNFNLIIFQASWTKVSAIVIANWISKLLKAWGFRIFLIGQEYLT